MTIAPRIAKGSSGLVNQKGTAEVRRGVMLSILKVGFGGSFVGRVGRGFDGVAAGNISGLDGAED